MDLHNQRKTLTIDRSSWHARIYFQWRQSHGGMMAQRQETLCHYFWTMMGYWLIHTRIARVFSPLVVILALAALCGITVGIVLVPDVMLALAESFGTIAGVLGLVWLVFTGFNVLGEKTWYSLLKWRLKMVWQRLAGPGRGLKRGFCRLSVRRRTVCSIGVVGLVLAGALLWDAIVTLQLLLTIGVIAGSVLIAGFAVALVSEGLHRRRRRATLKRAQQSTNDNPAPQQAPTITIWRVALATAKAKKAKLCPFITFTEPSEASS